MSAHWKCLPQETPPPDYIQAVQIHAPQAKDHWLAQILWQRGVQLPDLPAFLNPDHYHSIGPESFGPEMTLAIDRLIQARQTDEKVAIWGDFDADGVTATSLLWEGLGQFFAQGDRLIYYIPDRLTESHGLSNSGLERLHQAGYHLIITCDTGSGNAAEIDYGRSLGLEFIITDHHTLPSRRPNVIAIINPRHLNANHPLSSLSGVAVAYKLVEALYLALPAVPTQDLTELLDLVAIGLIADLVELRGESRYLAQTGIVQLQRAAAQNRRPGITKLLELCKRSGDRPTDISFGLGPRINAVSRIQGRADFCVELLTSRDEKTAHALAMETELANSRRRSLQKDMEKMVTAKVSQLDLSTTDVIVLADEQWHPGVLGLVASQIASQYDRPTILLTIDHGVARGSARSTRNVDLYSLVQDQADLLSKFGGHPYAAGLSLPVENLPMFTLGINQKLRQLQLRQEKVITADLQVIVKDLGFDLFQSLKYLEPCGMGNPSPKLLLCGVTFSEVRLKNLQDFKGGKTRYPRVNFLIQDSSGEFPAIWWGHRAEELPKGRSDVIIELESNPFKRCYEARLIDLRPAQDLTAARGIDWLWDWRLNRPDEPPVAALKMTQAPHSWTECRAWFRRAIKQGIPLALSYRTPQTLDVLARWYQLVGFAKYLDRTGERATRGEWCGQLDIGDRALGSGFRALQQVGFRVTGGELGFGIVQEGDLHEDNQMEALALWRLALEEEHFIARYFAQVPLAILEAIAIEEMEGMI